MYRIFCESYFNYIEMNIGNNYRSRIVEPFALIVDIDRYIEERNAKTTLYKKLCDLIYYMKEHLEVYPRFAAFLWTIEARDIEGVYFGIATEEDLEEQAKVVNMFLKLVYWDVSDSVK